MKETEKAVHDFVRHPLRRGALEDGVLILLSPLVILLALFLFPAFLVGGVVGVVMLWMSGAWTAGEKLIGMALAGISYVWAGIIGFDLHITDPNGGTGRVVVAVSLLLLVLFVQMVPGIVAVVYLARKLGGRSPRSMSARVNEVAAGNLS